MLELGERVWRIVTAPSFAAIINRASFSSGVTGKRIKKKKLKELDNQPERLLELHLKGESIEKKARRGPQFQISV
jgi:3-isopropylmalate dehydratase small subunit